MKTRLLPVMAVTALGVAESYRAARQWERAISAYERVVEVAPRREGEALLGIAWCCRSHDLSKARFYAGLAGQEGANIRTLRTALSGSCK